MTEENTLEGLRAEVDRLQRELDQASSEKIQSVSTVYSVLVLDAQIPFSLRS